MDAHMSIGFELREVKNKLKAESEQHVGMVTEKKTVIAWLPRNNEMESLI